MPRIKDILRKHVDFIGLSDDIVNTIGCHHDDKPSTIRNISIYPEGAIMATFVDIFNAELKKQFILSSISKRKQKRQHQKTSKEES